MVWSRFAVLWGRAPLRSEVALCLAAPLPGLSSGDGAASKTRLGAPPSPASQCQQAPGQSWEKPLWVPQALRGMWAGP